MISGTPTAAGISNVSLSATNSSTAEVGHATVTLTIGKATAGVTVPTQSVAYTGAAQAAGATTTPAGLTLTFTYNGSATAPQAIGTYTVAATVSDANYQGSGQGTLTITPAVAGITLSGLTGTYTGHAHPAIATTSPTGLPVKLTYDGLATVPVNAGVYDVAATVATPAYTASASGTMTIVPAVITGAAKTVTGRTAVLSGTTSSASVVTGAAFEYGIDTTYGTTVTATATTSGATLAEGATLSGLAPGTTYHYRLEVTSSVGPSVGGDKTFTTMPAPVIDPTPGIYLSATGVEIAQPVNPSGSAATIVFNYGTTSALGESTAAQAIHAGKTDATFFGLFPGLLPNTTYYFQAVTTSAAGTFSGPVLSFVTPGFDLALVAASATSLGGITAAALGDPAVNANEHVAYMANAGTSSAAVVFDDGYSTQAIASCGQTAPGEGAATFATLGDPVVNGNDTVAFRATLKPGASAGVWVTDGASLQLVAGVGSAAPLAAGGTSTFATMTAFGLSDVGVIISGTLKPSSTPLVNAVNNAGIWFEPSGGDLQEMVRLGDALTTPSGDKTITKLAFLPPSDPYVGGQTRSFAASTGSIVYGVTFNDKSTGIVKQATGGAPQLVAISGGAYASFGIPAINNNGHTAFAGTLNPGTGVTSTNNRGIWADDSSGARQLIAQSGATTPGRTATFATFSDPVYNDHEAVAFRATLQGSSATGIWATDADGQSLARVAAQGDPAAGCPDGAMFSTFGEVALPDQGGPNNHGGVLFTATLVGGSGSGVTSANNAGIWAVDSNGDLQLIVRTGDILQGKVVTALFFLPSSLTAGGQTRSFTAERGDLVFRATFMDKTTAIYNVVFP